MKMLFALTISIVLATAAFPQSKPAQTKPADPDRLGMTCAQILRKTSADWILYFLQRPAPAAADNPSRTLRAIAAYGKCYDDRTNRLAASLSKSGKGPLMGARGNFTDFESALKDFTAKALAAANAPEGSQKFAYASVFEKQFRYEFYQAYERKDLRPRPLTPEESDEFAKAKNHFGELLGVLPEAQMHTVHAAFSHIFSGGGSVSDVTKLEVYRYAIFLMESPKDTPFSPPPF